MIYILYVDSNIKGIHKTINQYDSEVIGIYNNLPDNVYDFTRKIMLKMSNYTDIDTVLEMSNIIIDNDKKNSEWVKIKYPNTSIRLRFSEIEIDSFNVKPKKHIDISLHI